QTVLGYTRAEAVGQLEVSNFFANPEDAESIVRSLANSEIGRQPAIRTVAVDQDGQKIPILLSVSRLGNGYVGFFQDQRKIESALQYIRQLEGLLEAVQAITKLTDMQSMLSTTVDKTMEMLKTDIVSLYLYEQESDKLYLPPARVGVVSRKEADVYAGPDHAARRMIRHGEAVFSHDARQNPLLSGDFVDQEGILSCAACPLKLREKIVGVLFCNYRSHHYFTDDEKAMINLFTSEISIALENARLFNETKQSEKQLQSLYQASIGLTEGLSTENILQTLVESARISTGAEYTALGILTPDWKLDPFVVSGLDRDEAALISHPPVGTGVLGTLLQQGQVINVADVRTHPDYVGQIPEKHPHITSFLGVPIFSQDQVIGDLYAANKIGASNFSHKDATNLKLLAAQAAIVMERMASQEAASATQTVNISFLLLSRWALTVRQQRSALEEGLKEIELSLRDEHGSQIPQILRRMSETIHDMDVPRQSLELQFQDNLTQTVNLSQLISKVATRPEVGRRIQSTPVLELQRICMVTGNELLLEFALNILINNSVEAIELKGRGGEIRVVCQTKDRIVQVHISDTGAGIPPHIQSHLYREPLRSGAGTGYGSLAAGMILKVHHGNIRIVSTGPEGTTINFWLPVAAQ
ncbi:MAG: GAF domain-containing protein, partial [Acidobacteria bacterium]|nr:GAF domain-containing protein [Acidobacteriota bacterium]